MRTILEGSQSHGPLKFIWSTDKLDDKIALSLNVPSTTSFSFLLLIIKRNDMVSALASALLDWTTPATDHGPACTLKTFTKYHFYLLQETFSRHCNLFFFPTFNILQSFSSPSSQIYSRDAGKSFWKWLTRNIEKNCVIVNPGKRLHKKNGQG